MADYGLYFSTMIEGLTGPEKAWLRAEYTRLMDGEEGVGFDLKTDPEGAWIYAEGGGNPDQVADVVQAFLQRFRPSESWGMEWSLSCSKPRLDAFGGGAVFVTATSKEWCNTHDWLQEKKG